MSTTITTTHGGPQVNMTCGNAAHILALLGLDYGDDGWGETNAADFHGRVTLAQALDNEHGHPDVKDGRWTTYGRRTGYNTDRLAELHEVAAWAVEHDANVTWG